MHRRGAVVRVVGRRCGRAPWVRAAKGRGQRHPNWRSLEAAAAGPAACARRVRRSRCASVRRYLVAVGLEDWPIARCALAGTITLPSIPLLPPYSVSRLRTRPLTTPGPPRPCRSVPLSPGGSSSHRHRPLALLYKQRGAAARLLCPNCTLNKGLPATAHAKCAAGLRLGAVMWREIVTRET